LRREKRCSLPPRRERRGRRQVARKVTTTITVSTGPARMSNGCTHWMSALPDFVKEIGGVHNRGGSGGTEEGERDEWIRTGASQWRGRDVRAAAVTFFAPPPAVPHAAQTKTKHHRTRARLGRPPKSPHSTRAVTTCEWSALSTKKRSLPSWRRSNCRCARQPPATLARSAWKGSGWSASRRCASG
jgi:hypothetical protein